jgi:hypothetical protein
VETGLYMIDVVTALATAVAVILLCAALAYLTLILRSVYRTTRLVEEVGDTLAGDIRSLRGMALLVIHKLRTLWKKERKQH